MLEDIIVFIVGLSVGALLKDDMQRRFRGALVRIRGGGRSDGPASTRQAMDHALTELAREEPDLAAQINQPPAVPPSSVPDEVSVAEIESDAHDNRLAKYDPHVTKLLRALRGWRPGSPTYGDERGYEDSMRRFLSKRNITKDVDYDYKPGFTLDLKAGAPRRLTPDFVFWEKLLVEVKGDIFRSSDSDRSLGQLFRYLLRWKSEGPAMLVICGECDPLLQLLIRQYVAVWRDKPFELAVTVFFAMHETVSDVPLVAAL